MDELDPELVHLMFVPARPTTQFRSDMDALSAEARRDSFLMLCAVIAYPILVGMACVVTAIATAHPC